MGKHSTISLPYSMNLVAFYVSVGKARLLRGEYIGRHRPDNFRHWREVDPYDVYWRSRREKWGWPDTLNGQRIALKPMAR